MATTKLSKRRRPRTGVATGAERESELDAELAQRELLGFPARLLPHLPLAVKFGIEVRGLSCRIDLVSWGCDAAPTDGARGSIAFDADELSALALAAQSERVWPSDFKGYCLRKLHDPSFRVTEAIALAGAQPDTAPAWSLGSVLSWLDVELLTIELIATPSATQTAQPSAPARQHRDAAAA